MILIKLSHLSRTKKIVGLSTIVATLIISVCVLQEICKPKLYKKLQGTYNILLEETYINRSTEFKPLSFTLTFENSDVELPTIRSANDNAARNYEGIKELERNAKGKWKVIGEKEDSILIDAPKNILYDYPQFALPLYNLCSNVGLYETAAITNRSNILSPKYLRLNL